MSFAVGTEVIYRNQFGIVDFVDDSYIVIEVPNVKEPERTSPRLVVHPWNYKNVTIAKSSTK